MKIEIGENLFYSWLRHVKGCHIVQTNWKVSPMWPMQSEKEVRDIAGKVDAFFSKKYQYSIYKKNSLSQLLQQGECDVLGININPEGNHKVYAVDVAFHRNGLGYGNAEENARRIVEKSVRTALCIYCFMGYKEAEIIFASPKINNSAIQCINSCIKDLNELLHKDGEYNFKVRLITNTEFYFSILQPIQKQSNVINDTAELFIRAYQLFSMFSQTSILSQSDEKKISKMDMSKTIQNVVQRNITEDNADALIVAYCFSVYGHDSLYSCNQTDSFEKAAKELNIKVSTLRNYRDCFDGHNNSSRKGWWQTDLSPSLQSIKNEYDGKSRTEVIEKCKCILGL